MEGADLKEAMKHWYAQEELVFGPVRAAQETGDGTARTAPRPVGPAAPQSMARVAGVKMARLFLMEYNSLPDLPAVLTLLDSMMVKAERTRCYGDLMLRPGGSALEASAFAASMAAVVRVAAKTKLVGYYPGKTVCAEKGASTKLEGIGLTTLKMQDVNSKELSILANFTDCIGMPTPVDWARGALALLDHEGKDPKLRQVLYQVMPCVDEWAQFLSVEFGSSGDMPPSWLALGACTLGLVSTGVMRPNAMWPEDLPNSAWQGSVLQRMEHALSSRPAAAAPPSSITAAQLSEALCCEQSAAAHRAYAVLTRLLRVQAAPPWMARA